ncbi:MAG: hypothetical protein K5898_14370 [Ruminococcus sp.]|uniref:hypothetical protein n=1 Tax=Ruminococcus sp. TaxID=41978 RepID=UPI0025D60F57|nr:hypothetical protein [Ruminococcus sp.]MCR4796326.1 hypothetical protein [Ruminococcus sp.]
MDNEETAEQGTTEELLDTYERKRKNKADDVIATQAVLCILLAVLFCCGRYFCPEVTEAIFGRLKSLTADSSCVIVNPIDLVRELLDKH